MHTTFTRRSLLAAAAAGALARTPVVRAQAAVDVAVSLPGPGNSVSIPLELAVKTGLDRGAGLALRLRFVGGGGVALQDLLAGNAQFAVFGLPAAMNHNLGSGPRIAALAAVDDLPLYTLMVREDLRASVRGIADLRGRTIGIHSNSLTSRSTSHQLLDLILRSHGVALDSVRFVAAGQNWQTQSSALRSGAVDATMCDEPFGTRMALENLAFRLFSTGVPADAARTPGAGFLRATLMARRDAVEASPELAAGMVQLVRRTLARIAELGPEGASAALELAAGAERDAFVEVFRRYPRQYSRDARFSAVQLRETEVFFRASMDGDPRAAAFDLDAMVVDRWAGRKA